LKHVSALSLYSIVSTLSGVGYTKIIVGFGEDKYTNSNPTARLTKKYGIDKYFINILYIGNILFFITQN